MFNLPPGTKWLALAMLAAFALQNVLEGQAWSWFMTTFAFVSTTFWPPGSELPGLTGLASLVTYAFLHGDFMHILLNLGFLLAFGSFVERHIGLVPYLLLFALTAAAGALCEFFFRGGRENVTRAVECFTGILDANPNYALAYAGLTKSLFFMDYYFGARCQNGAPQAVPSA